VLSTARQKKLKDAIWNAEKVDSVTKLMALMTADVRANQSKSAIADAKKEHRKR
jgi:hypothetical protein